MFGLGMSELLIILAIVILLFGAKKLPDLASGIGKAIKNFKKATSEPDEIDITPKKGVTEDKEKTEGKASEK